MIEFLKGLLSNDKIIDAGVNAGDKMVFTNEEKSDAQNEADKLRLEHIRQTMPAERTRRFIAIAVVCAWLVNGAIAMMFLIANLGLAWYSLYHPEFKYPDMIKPVVDFALWYVMPSFNTVMAFYFWKRIKEQK